MANRPSTRITTRGEQTRDIILASARKLFTERGYHYTSVYDLFDHAETTKGAFFHHWKTKEDLALSLLQRMEGHFEDHFFSILEEPGRTRDKLEKAITLLSHDAHGNGCFGRLFSIWCVELRPDEEKIGPEVHRVKTRWCGFWKELIKRAQDEKDIRSDISPENLSFLVISAICGVQLMQREQGSENAQIYEALRITLLT